MPMEGAWRPTLSWRWIGLLALYRVINASLVRTYFDPDEYWQGPEIAHCFAFGYGHQAWEWSAQIRGFFHPLVFATFYWVLRVLGLDGYPVLVVWIPRLPQALLLAFSDGAVYSLAGQLFGRRVARWALFSHVTNWFVFFAGVRTLSNSMETALITIALSYWPWRGSGPVAASVFLGGLSILVRPTAIAFWAPLGALHLWTMDGGWRARLRLILIQLVPIAVLIGGISLVVDYWFFGEWVFPPLGFVRLNVGLSLSHLYGTHSWHWYFSQGFWTILGAYSPIFLWGVWKARAMRTKFAASVIGLIVWVNLVFSLNAHKEFRFVFPVLPLALVLCGVAWDSMYPVEADGDGDADADTEVVVRPGLGLRLRLRQKVDGSPKSTSKSKTPVKRVSAISWLLSHRLLVSLLLVQVAMAAYFSGWHQLGAVDVVDWLRMDSIEAGAEAEVGMGCTRTDIHGNVTGMQIQWTRPDGSCVPYSVLFLTPCHATPFYSRIHRRVPMRFLDCSPLGQQWQGMGEAARFFDAPLEFLEGMFPKKSKSEPVCLPSRVVMFDTLVPRISQWLADGGYSEAYRVFHAIDERSASGTRGRNIVVYSV